MTKEFIGENGKLTGIKAVEVSFETGKLVEKKGSERVIPCELALLAAGFIHPQKEGMLEQLKVGLDKRGNVETRNFKTSSDKVFAAGDMRRGQSLVVWAIAEGRKAAAKVGEFLEL